MCMSTQVCERRAQVAEQRESQASSDAQQARQELNDLQQKHVLMEEEYWVSVKAS